MWVVSQTFHPEGMSVSPQVLSLPRVCVRLIWGVCESSSQGLTPEVLTQRVRAMLQSLRPPSLPGGCRFGHHPWCGAVSPRLSFEAVKRDSGGWVAGFQARPVDSSHAGALTSPPRCPCPLGNLQEKAAFIHTRGSPPSKCCWGGISASQGRQMLGADGCSALGYG